MSPDNPYYQFHSLQEQGIETGAARLLQSRSTNLSAREAADKEHINSLISRIMDRTGAQRKSASPLEVKRSNQLGAA